MIQPDGERVHGEVAAGEVRCEGRRLHDRQGAGPPIGLASRAGYIDAAAVREDDRRREEDRVLEGPSAEARRQLARQRHGAAFHHEVEVGPLVDSAEQEIPDQTPDRGDRNAERVAVRPRHAKDLTHPARQAVELRRDREGQPRRRPGVAEDDARGSLRSFDQEERSIGSETAPDVDLGGRRAHGRGVPEDRGERRTLEPQRHCADEVCPGRPPARPTRTATRGARWRCAARAASDTVTPGETTATGRSIRPPARRSTCG